ncbi:putative late blight resistance protein homolog R1B-16, partial [Camellia sinensis]|uniref:putative late blight resistance protein homolog R1B-16 n=1 Tax=Camellia sinensis TaxID=4442 RepID=UPI001035EA46
LSYNPYDCYPFSLDNLQTLSLVDPQSCGDFLGGTRNLKRLGFQGHVECGGCLTFPRLDSLNNLQELRLFNTIWYLDTGIRSNNLGGIKFPSNLKKLTLKKTYLGWDEMSTLSKLLPNLECLKLLEKACNGQSWETSRDFSGLKFLKLASLNIVWWNACSNHFPSLQQLVISKCHCLAKIPSEIGYIPTLQMI